jgi:hypothetical protein
MPSEDFYNGSISSYSKGCANPVVPLFHVATETAALPRLHCFHCSVLERVGQHHDWSSLGWGELGGGNFALKIGAQQGWFVNHKAEYQFYQAWTNQSVCPAFPATPASLPPPCTSPAKGLISACNGIFYDVVGEHLCYDADGAVPLWGYGDVGGCATEVEERKNVQYAQTDDMALIEQVSGLQV